MTEKIEKKRSIGQLGIFPNATAYPAKKRSVDRLDIQAISAIGFPLNLIEGWE
jgi:hypothetical protein